MEAAPSMCVQAQRSIHIRRYSVQADTEVRFCTVAHAPNQLAVGKGHSAISSLQKAVCKVQFAKSSWQYRVGKIINDK
jgi:hypothetical protein